MNLRNHSITSLVNFDRKFLSEVGFEIGTQVQFCTDPNSSGILVERIDNDTVKVLWSSINEPHDYVRRVPYNTIAQQIFTVQPLPLPNALTYYIDDLKTRTFSIKEEEDET